MQHRQLTDLWLVWIVLRQHTSLHGIVDNLLGNYVQEPFSIPQFFDVAEDIHDLESWLCLSAHQLR